MDIYFIIGQVLLIVFIAIASYTDIKYRKIENRLLLIMLLVGIILLFTRFSTVNMINAALGLIVALVLFLPVYLISKSGLGAGDVKLALCMSVYTGLYDFMNIMIYSLIYTVIFGIAIMIFRRKRAKMQLPFAPFVLMGCITNVSFYLINIGG